MIELDNVNKWYGPNHHCLKAITAKVHKGEVVVLCGPSGSGKTTLIRSINRLEAIQGGRITVNGEDVHGKDAELNRIRRGIGFVFQQFNLFPHMSVLDNITIAPRKLKGMGRAEAEDKAHALLKRVGLSDKAAAYPLQLSGGQSQRVAIARALAMDPPVILFDEPTSALDPEMVGEVLNVIKDLAHTGITMMCVTHEMGFARDVADRVWFLDRGQLIEDASPQQFFSKPNSERAQKFLADLRH